MAALEVRRLSLAMGSDSKWLQITRIKENSAFYCEREKV